MSETKIANLLKILEFLSAIGKTTSAALADDKKISFSEMAGYLPILLKLPGVLSAFPEIPKELSTEFSKEDIETLKTVLKDSGVVPVNSEAAVYEGLEIMINLKNYIFKYFVSTAKAPVA